MRTFLFTLCLTAIAFTIQAQTVTIPDTLFRNALIEKGVDTNNDSLIQVSEAESITRLSVYGKGITDLTGIEAFTNLTFLRCDTNKLTDIDFQGTPNIDTLWCNNNLFQTLDISSLTELVYLNIALCQLTSFSTNTNTKLEWYDIGGNSAVSSVDLSNNSLLTFLDIVRMPALNAIDLSPVPLLEVLAAAINYNSLPAIDVSLNTNLTTLFLTNYLPGAAKTICVNETQAASTPPPGPGGAGGVALIPTGWSLNPSDVISTTGCTVGIEEFTNRNTPKVLIHIFNLMGQEVDINNATEGVFIYQYSDGTSEKRATIAQ